MQCLFLYVETSSVSAESRTQVCNVLMNIQILEHPCLVVLSSTTIGGIYFLGRFFFCLFLYRSSNLPMAYLEFYQPLYLVMKITFFWKLPIYLTFLVYFFTRFFEIVLKLLKISSISLVICFNCDFLLF